MLVIAAFAGVWFAYPFPVELLDRPRSPVVTDRHGRVLIERVAGDDQWRLPVALDDISPWLVAATIAVAARRFHEHPGLDAVAVARAASTNILSARRVSGASTISMQLCRMIDPRPRTWSAKAIEAFRALELERIRNKSEILEAYLNDAPYGGNLRGAEAAAEVWFGKQACDLSLGEAALLAGLPQSPRAYRPDRHPDAARARRSYVLRRMAELGSITCDEQRAADNEPVPPKRRGHLAEAAHAAVVALKRRPSGAQTAIDLDIQHEVERVAGDYAATLPEQTDFAIVVIEIESG